MKTSGIEGFAVISRQRKPPFHFIRLVREHPVVKTAPLPVATIQFFVGLFERIGRATTDQAGVRIRDINRPVDSLQTFLRASGDAIAKPFELVARFDGSLARPDQGM